MRSRFGQTPQLPRPQCVPSRSAGLLSCFGSDTSSLGSASFPPLTAGRPVQLPHPLYLSPPEFHYRRWLKWLGSQYELPFSSSRHHHRHRLSPAPTKGRSRETEEERTPAKAARYQKKRSVYGITSQSIILRKKGDEKKKKSVNGFLGRRSVSVLHYIEVFLRAQCVSSYKRKREQKEGRVLTKIRHPRSPVGSTQRRG
jgi:hypothetical protein